MKVVVEVIALPTVLGLAADAWVTFTIAANAPDVAAALVGKKNIRSEIDVLGAAFKAAASKRQLGQINSLVD
jgi:hypothetical protein